jgi:hypothetical protein
MAAFYAYVAAVVGFGSGGKRGQIGFASVHGAFVFGYQPQRFPV